MLVSQIIGDCPQCGVRQGFGNVSVGGNTVLRGCMKCNYTTKVYLPEVKKKIIYLDQFFFSAAFRECDIRFVEAAKKNRKISDLQLLAVPFPAIHEQETHQWRGYGGKGKDNLMEFIKKTSRGHKFKQPYYVEEKQIVNAFQDFLAGKSEDFEIQECNALDDDIHKWEDYFWIDVGGYVGDVELYRDLKQQSVEGLVDLFPSWRQSTNSFEQNVDLENQAAAKAYIDSYLQYSLRIAKGDLNALFDSPVMSKILESLFHCMPKSEKPEYEVEAIEYFFRSPHFAKIPYQFISSHVFAALKGMVKHGSFINREKSIRRLGGVFQDISHIATYAPYCDAFIMDQAMASLVRGPNFDLESKYSVNVYSLNNWDELLAWLDSLEHEMTPEHREGLTEAYP